MTDSEVDQFIDRLNGLWPEKITAEQADVWRAYVRKLSAADAGSTLGHYFANEKTATPKLGRFRAAVEYLQQDRGGSGGRCHPRDPDHIHTTRHRWMKARPSEAGAIDAMPHGEVWLLQLRWVFQTAVDVHGLSALASTRKAFDDWQDQAEKCGYSRVDFDSAFDSELAAMKARRERDAAIMAAEMAAA